MNLDRKIKNKLFCRGEIYLMIDQEKKKIFKYVRNKVVDLNDFNLDDFKQAYLEENFAKIFLLSSLNIYGNKNYTSYFSLPTSKQLFELFWDEFIFQYKKLIQTGKVDVFYWSPIYIMPIFVNDSQSNINSYFDYFDLPSNYLNPNFSIYSMKNKLKLNKFNQDNVLKDYSKEIDYLINNENQNNLLSNYLVGKLNNNRKTFIPNKLIDNNFGVFQNKEQLIKFIETNTLENEN